MPKVIIIGGGIAGCTTALELAGKGYDVTILEQSDDILKGTSARTPGRMGLGFHYFDYNTAKLYMELTIEFIKKYPDCFLGKEKSYLQDGRYFVVKDSLIEWQDLMVTYQEISDHYIEICKKDPTNNIFETSVLHKVLRKPEYESDVNKDKISFAIETKERLLDWKKFDEKLRGEISNNRKIRTMTNFKVTDISTTEDGAFIISDNEKKSKESSDYVINCSWQNIELLDKKLGLGSASSRKENPEQSASSRLKLLAEVKLPESLKEKHSMFFCVGPHAMFSNLGNGIGRITYAPITNYGVTTEEKIPDLWSKWLSSGLDKEEEQYYGKKIIDGVAQYIPEMRNAELISVTPGIVKSRGSVELSDKNSSFHKRDYSGVESQQIGWIDNAAMKLFYCLGNAREVSEILEKQQSTKKVIVNIAEELITKRKRKRSPENYADSDSPSSEDEFIKEDLNEKIFKQFFINYLQRNFSENLLDSITALSTRRDMEQTTKNKKDLLRSLPKNAVKPSDVKKLRQQTTDKAK